MGNLAETPLPGLLLSLARDGFEGWLALERPGIALRLRWRKGQPIELVSSREEDSLRAVLTARGALAPDVAETAAARMRDKKASELQALAGAGVPPKEIVLALAATLERALAECLAWTQGSFQLQFEPAPGHAPALPFSLVGLVYRAIAGSWRSDQVLVGLGARATRYAALPADAVQRLDPRLAKLPSFQALLPLLQGAHTPFEALREARHPEAHAALFVLDAQGLLAYTDQRPAAGEARAAASGPQIEIVVAGAAAAAAGRSAEAASAKRDPAREAAARDLAREVAALHERLADLDHWQILGVERGAIPSEVKRAYLKLAKRLHPDHLMRLGLAEWKEKANEVFAQVSRAHEVLTDAEERARYEESQSGVSETEALLAGQAEQYFQRGEMLVRAGNFRGAVQLFERAVQTYEREADYHGGLAWALHRMTPPDNPRALAHFERALELGGEQAQLLLRMSLVLRELGDARAGPMAQRARSMDPGVKA